MKTIEQLKDLQEKVVFVRVDFNVPFKDGEIRDDNRIVSALPTIKELIKRNAKVVLLSHLGKIKHKEDAEKVEEMKKKNSLAPVAIRLSELLHTEVSFCPETHGKELEYFVSTLKPGGVLLVQNTRYEKGEEKNDEALAKEWAKLADAFIMDAFGSAHRAHASTYGLPHILKKEGKEVGIGFLVEKEVLALTRCVKVREEDRPYIAILGGLKVSDKIKVINTLLDKCDKVIIGGAMAYTFYKAKGQTIGQSPCEDDQLDYARSCLEKAGDKIVLPVDSICTNGFKDWTEKITVEGSIPDGFQGMDIGPKSVELFKKEIASAKMVFWNGPMGVFEQDDFANGTKGVCEAITNLKNAFTVIGGGDSAAAAKDFGFKEGFSHVSTGGGASLEMIENDGHLPGLDVLED